MIIDAIYLEARVAGVAPEDRSHAQLVSGGESHAHLVQLARALGRAPVHSRAYGDAAHVARLLGGSEHRLVVAIRKREELIVVELEDERDLVRVLLGVEPEHA